MAGDGDNKSQKSQKSQKSGGGGGGGQSLGASRETWCAVECKKEQDWCRATRKHFSQHLESSVFNPNGCEVEEPKKNVFDPEKTPPKQRKHFDQHNASCLYM